MREPTVQSARGFSHRHTSISHLQRYHVPYPCTLSCSSVLLSFHLHFILFTLLVLRRQLYQIMFSYHNIFVLFPSFSYIMLLQKNKRCDEYYVFAHLQSRRFSEHIKCGYDFTLKLCFSFSPQVFNANEGKMIMMMCNLACVCFVNLKRHSLWVHNMLCYTIPSDCVSES